MTTQQMYEVLDANGMPTGQTMDSAAVHDRQLWHAVVNVWIINSRGELLMQLRGPKVDVSPGLWDVSIGSHVRPGETPEQAALRCLADTLTVAANHEEVRHLFNTLSENPLPDGKVHRVLGHVFLLQRDLDLSIIPFGHDKISELKWVPFTQLMTEIGNEATRGEYLPRANNYYPQLFQAFETYI